MWGEKTKYGRKYMGILRSAFLIDEKGKIAEAWYKISPKDTPTNLLKALGDVSGRRPPADRRPAAPPAVPASSTRSPSSSPGESAHAAVWHLTGDEAFFAGHFPGRPDAAGRAHGRGASPSSARSPCSPTSASPASSRCSAGSTGPASAARSCPATRSSSRSSWAACRPRAGKGHGRARSVDGEVGLRGRPAVRARRRRRDLSDAARRASGSGADHERSRCGRRSRSCSTASGPGSTARASPVHDVDVRSPGRASRSPRSAG